MYVVMLPSVLGGSRCHTLLQHENERIKKFLKKRMKKGTDEPINLYINVICSLRMYIRFANELLY